MSAKRTKEQARPIQMVKRVDETSKPDLDSEIGFFINETGVARAFFLETECHGAEDTNPDIVHEAGLQLAQAIRKFANKVHPGFYGKGVSA